MDKVEAQEIINELFAPYKAFTWEDSLDLLGKETVTRHIGKSGTEYFFQLDVSYVNELEDVIEIEGLVSEAGGRSILPPTLSDRIYLSRPSK